MSRRVWLLALALGVGCGGSKYAYGPLGEIVSPPRAGDCDFALLDKPPTEAFDALGILAPADIGSSRLATDEGAFKKAASAAVCAAGGDAVVFERVADGRIVRGTVIRMR